MSLHRFFLILLISGSAIADSSTEVSFEQSYNLLEKKIDALKEKGEKVSDQTRKELDALLAQMNHQHTELKRQLEKKNQEVNARIEQTRKVQEDWSKRAVGAYAELKNGLEKAWIQLSKKDASPTETEDK